MIYEEPGLCQRASALFSLPARFVLSATIHLRFLLPLPVSTIRLIERGERWKAESIACRPDFHRLIGYFLGLYLYPIGNHSHTQRRTHDHNNRTHLKLASTKDRTQPDRLSGYAVHIGSHGCEPGPLLRSRYPLPRSHRLAWSRTGADCRCQLCLSAHRRHRLYSHRPHFVQTGASLPDPCHRRAAIVLRSAHRGRLRLRCPRGSSRQHSYRHNPESDARRVLRYQRSLVHPPGSGLMKL